MNVGAQAASAEQTVTQQGGIRVLKYEDTNGDGVQGPGESGLGGWQFCLYTEAGAAYPGTANQLCVTTGTDGTAVFMGVPVANYQVCEVLQSGWDNTDPGGSPACKLATASAGVGSTGSISDTLVIAGDGTYQVEFLGVTSDGRTWSYRVTEISGKNLSHWVLGLCMNKNGCVQN